MFRFARPLTLIAALSATFAVTPVHADSSTSAGPGAITISAGQAAVGQALLLTLSVTNTTATPITSLMLGASFPLATRMVAPLPNPDLCGRGGSGGIVMGFACLLPDLQPGATATIPFGLSPASSANLTVQASDSGYVAGTWRSGSTSLSIPVSPAATDIQVSGSASTGSPKAGANFSYTFQVRNGSSHPAYGVTFSNVLAAGVTPITASTSTGSPCTLSTGEVDCTLGDVGGGTPIVSHHGGCGAQRASDTHFHRQRIRHQRRHAAEQQQHQRHRRLYLDHK